MRGFHGWWAFMMIRNYDPQDATALAAIFHAAVHGVGAAYYSAEQCKAWSPAPMGAASWAARITQAHSVFVAEIDHLPVGFIELRAEGSIDCFYIHPDHTRQGVSTALYASLEAEACACGLRHLWVEASVPARSFFTRQGFKTLTRQEFPHRGVMMFNWKMEKRLSPS